MQDRKKANEDGDYLFEGCPEHVKSLWREAKKAKRNKERREWSSRNLMNRRDDDETQD